MSDEMFKTLCYSVTIIVIALCSFKPWEKSDRSQS